jgi:flagellar motor switch protein FliG
MAGLKTATNEEVTAVVGSFVTAMSDRASIEVGSDEYIKKILTSALGDEKASTILDRILLGRTSSGLDVLKYMEPKAIAEPDGGCRPARRVPALANDGGLSGRRA